jgi:hypothetical protein
MRVLDDHKLPLDNTRSERALRKIVVGRKAWMFYGSDTHAEAAAAIFSVIACKRCTNPTWRATGAAGTMRACANATRMRNGPRWSTW